MRTCAILTRLVITATHKPASTPTPMASAVMPNSLARKRARAVARTINAGRGKVSQPSGSARSPMAELMRGEA